MTKDMKILTIKLALLGVLSGFLLLWFSGVFPPKVAQVVASTYIEKQADGAGFKITGSDFSSGHGCYFVYFTHAETGAQRNIGIYYPYFPINVYFDSFRSH